MRNHGLAMEVELRTTSSSQSVLPQIQAHFQTMLQKGPFAYPPIPEAATSRALASTACYVPYHHVTPDNITRFPVRISHPDTTGTHPAARGMSGPFRKDLDNSQYFGTSSRAVGYSLYLGTTSDDTICLSFLFPTHMFFMIFYLMLFITIL